MSVRTAGIQRREKSVGVRQRSDLDGENVALLGKAQEYLGGTPKTKAHRLLSKCILDYGVP